ncbi:MAG: ATP-binding protein, partial [Spirochaetales bacterium]|nr:ATP-binding protein [Spirochaetales bacterium]
MQLNFSIPGDDMDLAGIASSTLKKKLQQIGVDNSIIKRTVVALYEAEINMVIHGGGGDITINVTPTEIQCELTDHGPGIADVNLAMQEGYSTATDAIREMGFGAGMG